MGGDDGVERFLQGVLVDLSALPPVDRFRRATEITVELGAVREAIAKVRAGAARELRDTEGLSISQVAVRLGVSKPRAQQLLDSSK